MRLTHPRGQASVCVEIDSVSVLLDKIKNKILMFVSVSSRGKRMGSYGTNPRLYTVDYEIKIKGAYSPKHAQKQ